MNDNEIFHALGVGYVISKTTSDKDGYDKFYIKLNERINRDLLANIIGICFEYYDELHTIKMAFGHVPKQISDFDIYTKQFNKNGINN